MEEPMKSYSVKYRDKAKLYDVLYNLLHRNDLTNPEITFFMRNEKYGDAETLTFTRDGETGIPGIKKWKSLISRDPKAFLFIASTDVQDIRRLTVSFLSNKTDPTLLINFPSAQKRLTGKEKRILEFLNENAKLNM